MILITDSVLDMLIRINRFYQSRYIDSLFIDMPPTTPEPEHADGFWIPITIFSHKVMALLDIGKTCPLFPPTLSTNSGFRK